MDGSSVGTNMITWISTTHFFKKEKLIVIYIGEYHKDSKICRGFPVIDGTTEFIIFKFHYKNYGCFSYPLFFLIAKKYTIANIIIVTKPSIIV